jgi:hypothetical protein
MGKMFGRSKARSATVVVVSALVAIPLVVAGVHVGPAGVKAQSAATLINVAFGPQQVWLPAGSGVQEVNGTSTPCTPSAGSNLCPISGAGVAENLNQQCPAAAGSPTGSGNGSATCIEQAMQQEGASPDAIAFYALTGRILLDFEPEGTVNLGTVVHDIWCCTADTDDLEPVLLGGVPAVVYPFEELSSVPLSSYSGYADAASQFPQLSIFGFDAMSFEQVTTSPEGGQRFIFDLSLANGCHACGTGLVARAALDFDPDGSFVQSVPLGIASEPGS